MTSDDSDFDADPLHQQVSAAVVNYQTPDLLDTAVRSFRDVYPTVPLLIVDNGSEDESPQLIQRLQDELQVTGLCLDTNRYHGPAMDLALRTLETPFVFLLDSDTHTHRGGYLEEMLGLCRPDDVYGAGKLARVNSRGFAAKHGTPVLVSAFMLIKRQLYLSLPPFIHHGLPALKNFQEAERRGYRLVPFPIEEYVEHFGRGTAERFGYGLGIKGRIEYLLNRLGF